MKMKKKGYAMGGMKKGYAMGGMKKKMKAGGGVKKMAAGKEVGMDPMGLMKPKGKAAPKPMRPPMKRRQKKPAAPAVKMPTPMNPGTRMDDMKRPMPMAKKGGSIKKMKAGGVAKKGKAKGGKMGGKSKVRGAGIAQRGVRPAQMR